MLELFIGMSSSVLGCSEDQWGFGLFWLYAFSLSSKSYYLCVHLCSLPEELTNKTLSSDMPVISSPPTVI